MKKTTVDQFHALLKFANYLGKDFISKHPTYADKTDLRIAHTQLKVARLTQAIQAWSDRKPDPEFKTHSCQKAHLDFIQAKIVELETQKAINEKKLTMLSGNTVNDNRFVKLHNEHIRTKRQLAFCRDKLKAAIRRSVKSDPAENKNLDTIDQATNQLLNQCIQLNHSFNVDESAVNQAAINLQTKRFESVKAFLNDQNNFADKIIKQYDKKSQKKTYANYFDYDDIENFKADLCLMYHAFKDKGAAKSVLNEESLGDHAYARIQNKHAISLEERKQIHAGLLILMFSTLNEGEDLEALKTYYQKLDDSKGSIKDIAFNYKQIQLALESFHEQHQLCEDLIAGIYSGISGLNKGIAACVAFLMFSFFPSGYMAIILFSLSLLLYHYRFYWPGSKHNVTRLVVSVIAFFTFSTLVYLFPLFPWFFLSAALGFGSLGALNSWQTIKGLCRDYNKKNNVKNQGPFDFLTKKVIHGKSVELTLGEKKLVCIICLPLSIAPQIFFLFPSYQLMIYFIYKLPFLSFLAAYPLTPSFIWALVAIMQLIGVYTTFKFIKNQCLDFFDYSREELWDRAKYFFRQELTAISEKPFSASFKLIFKLFLVIMFIAYVYLGVWYASMAILRLLPGIASYTSTAMFIAPFLFFAQLFFSLKSNRQLFDAGVYLITALHDKIASLFSKKKTLQIKIDKEDQTILSDIASSLKNEDKAFTEQLHRKNKLVAVFNILGKAATKLDPISYNWHALFNVVVELINASASTFLGIKEASGEKLHQKDVNILHLLIQGENLGQVVEPPISHEAFSGFSPNTPETPASTKKEDNHDEKDQDQAGLLKPTALNRLSDPSSKSPERKRAEQLYAMVHC